MFKRISVTDEQLLECAQRGETFSREYWTRLAPEQREKLAQLRADWVAAKAARLSKLVTSYSYSRNDATAAWEDHKNANLKDTEAKTLEASYRLAEVRDQLIGGWPRWPWIRSAILAMIALVFITELSRRVWPVLGARLSWAYFAGALALIGYGIYYELYLRTLHAEYRLDWELAKMAPRREATGSERPGNALSADEGPDCAQSRH